MTARGQKPSEATSLSEMTMISADRMKSVRTAPETTFFSWAAGSAAADSRVCSGAGWCPESSSQIFSAPS